MSRNSAGTYTVPPAVNPVVAGTTITPTWANTTLADIATEMTDSLSRSGKGGMTAPLRTADGTVAAPAHSYTSETGTGWFRHAAGEARLAILGTYRLAVNATTATVNAALTAIGKLTASAGLDVTGTVTLLNTTTTGNKIVTSATDAAGVVALTVDADNALTQGNLLDLTNNGTSKFSVDYAGVPSLVRGFPTGEVVLSGDTSSNSTVLGDISGFSFSAAANGVYEAEFLGSCKSGVSSTGLAFSFTGPASPTTLVFGSTASGLAEAEAYSDPANITAAGSSTAHVFDGKLRLVNGANAGTVQLQIAASASPGTITVHKGTTFRWRRVA